MNAPFPSDKLQRFGKTLSEYQRRVAKDQQSKRGWYDERGVRQGGLIAFVRYFWHVLEPETPFVDGWPLWAMCEHLETVTFGEINRLLINVPPGFMKSMLVDVFWPAWEWGPMKKTHYRYVAFSYSASLTERDNDRFRTLITSEAYQRLYGPLRYKFDESERVDGVGLRNKTTIKVMNTKTGWKLASSGGGVATGERGDRIIIDDPHSVQEAESERVREETVRWFRESISSRFNNLDTGALVIIMQRVHYDDVSGVALSKDFNYCHLCIPWEFDVSRAFQGGEAVTNAIGWIDPRADLDPSTMDGTPAWLDRFSPDAIARLRREGGPYAWASQYQQSPVPRGEGIFRREWWEPWDPPDGKFPEFDMIIASLDGAFTEKEENDFSAFTLWGIFTQPVPQDDGGDPGHLFEVELAARRKIMLIKAWQRHLPFSASRIPMKPGESYGVWRQRTQSEWGLIEWVHDSCTWFNNRPLKIDRLLIEAKGPGISAAQEISSRYGIYDIPVQLVQVKGDKIARALAVQPTFSSALVYAPVKPWVEDVIDECERFPRGKHDDMVDSVTQALRYFRDIGEARTDEEEVFAARERVTHKGRRKSLYFG